MHKYVFLLLIVLSSLSFCQETSTENKAYNNAMKAMELMDNGDIEKAIELLEESVKLVPESPDYLYELGYAFYLKEDIKKAIEIFERIVKMDKNSDQCFQMLGNFYDLNGESEKAIDTYNKGLEKFPNSGRLYLELGNMFRDDLNKAIEYYEKGIKVDPKFPSNYYQVSKIFCNSTEEVWGVIYGELFMNIERGSKRTVEVSELLYDVYSSEIKFGDDSNINVSFCKNESMSFDAANRKLPFGLTVFEPTLGLSAIGEDSITIGSLFRIRERFIKNYYEKGFDKTHPNVLFEWHKKLLENGKFEAYNYWLFMQGNGEEFNNWKIENEQKNDEFITWFGENPIDINNDNIFSRTNY